MHFAGNLPLRLRDSWRQRAVVNRIRRLGGVIGYAHEWDEELDRHTNAPVPGSWFTRLILGQHFFLEPRCVILSEFRGSNTELEVLHGLPEITDLGIIDSPHLDDRLIDTVRHLDSVTYLSLYGTSVTATGAKKLVELPKLRSLVLSNTKVATHELESLQRCLPDCEIFLECLCEDA